MSFEIFMFLLLVVSVMTGLVTQAMKAFLKELKINYYANTLAGAVSVVLSLAAGAAYLVMTETAINSKMAVLLIALVLLSWLSAMIGYDKVIQAISQFTTKGGI